MTTKAQDRTRRRRRKNIRKRLAKTGGKSRSVLAAEYELEWKRGQVERWLAYAKEHPDARPSEAIVADMAELGMKGDTP